MPTPGFQVQLPQNPMIPSNIGHVDVSGGYDTILRALAAQQQMSQAPVENIQRMAQLRTLLARAQQEEQLRPLATQAQQAQLTGEIQQAPYRTNILGSQAGIAGNQALLSKAGLPAALQSASNEAEKHKFLATGGGAGLAFGPATVVDSGVVRNPETGEITRTQNVAKTYGGQSYNVGLTSQTEPGQASFEEAASDQSGVPFGFTKMEMKNAAGDVLGNKYVQSNWHAAMTGRVQSYLDQANALRQQGRNDEADMFERQAQRESEMASKIYGKQPAAAIQKENTIRQLREANNRLDPDSQEYKNNAAAISRLESLNTAKPTNTESTTTITADEEGNVTKHTVTKKAGPDNTQANTPPPSRTLAKTPSPQIPSFATQADAEKYIHDNNLRGRVRLVVGGKEMDAVIE